ncbi:MAG TPA: ImmA/IrrE family metallo-endopeptidase [Pirellulales bacterium]|jgi:hypothetical protein
MLPEIPAEELADGLDRVARRLLKRCGVRKPPVDAMRMATTLGIETVVDSGQSSRARYVELRAARGGSPRPAILLRPEPRSERRQWAVAHELGEREAAVVFKRLAIDPCIAPPTAREWVANQLANRILLPTRWLASAGAACGWDLFTLKQRFATASHELILRRMLEFETPIVVTIFDHGAISFRQGNRGGRLSILPVERECWRTAHESGIVAERSAAGCAARCWPVHEEGWKREVLRLDLLDEPEVWSDDEPAISQE